MGLWEPREPTGAWSVVNLKYGSQYGACLPPARFGCLGEAGKGRRVELTQAGILPGKHDGGWGETGMRKMRVGVSTKEIY